MDAVGNFEDQIINYLREQEIFAEDHLRTFSLIVPPEEEVGIILDEIIDTVIKRTACKDRYDYTKLWHNQFPLFDFCDIIPDFCIGKSLTTCRKFNQQLH